MLFARVAGVVFVAACAAGMLSLARGYVDPHDGSCIAVLARNLGETGRYGYAREGRFDLWPVEATTGPTLVLPIALAYRMVGPGPYVANVTSALLALLLLAALWHAMLPKLTSVVAVLSSLVALVLVVGITIKPSAAWVVPRGEVVAGSLLVLATLVAFADGSTPDRPRRLASGLLIGLGLASKLLLLLPGAALLAVLLWRDVRSVGWVRALAAAVVLAAAAALVLLAVEVGKLASFGDWASYVARWREFVEFFRVAGSGLRDGPGALSERRTLAYRFGVVGENLGVFGAVLALALLVWPVLAWRARRGRLSSDGWIALALGAETLAVAVWWLWRADIPWLRYLFFACFTAPLFVHFVVLEAGHHGTRGARLALGAWMVLLAVAWIASPATPSWPGPSASWSARADAVVAAANTVRRIAEEDPEARFWGAGWWQHWDVQSVSPLALGNVLADSAADEMRAGHEYLLTSDYFNWE